MTRTSPLSVVLAVFTVALALAGCPSSSRSSGGAARGAGTGSSAPRVEPVALEVAFSSEKRAWAEEALAQFAASAPRTADGRPIAVHATYTGSVEPIADIVAGRIHPHVFSPASTLVVPLLNDEWTRARGASARPIAPAADALLLSPVVVAMWRPMAEALGWPARRLGWSDLAHLAQEPGGWRAHGHPEWGDFRFGHTHPGYSNSGLISVLAADYAAIGRTRDLTPADVGSEQARSFLRNIESAVVHYGRSTGFFYDALAHHGPAYLSAAVLYENLVVTAGTEPGATPLPFPLVCLYPREGTMWADHPYVVLDAPWVGAPERDAAARLRTFLLSRPVQERAMTRFGFRPANTDVATGAPLDAAHGADPHEPQTLLATPDVGTLQAALAAWRETKRGVSVTLVFDRSGSMNGGALESAREGVLQFLTVLQPTDRVTLLTFSDAIDPPAPAAAPADVAPRVRNIFAEGGTALYDAVDRARTMAEQDAQRDRTHIHAVVVLTDGEDRNSRLPLADLLRHIGSAESGSAVRVFTIGYGVEANEGVLAQIAQPTGGIFYRGSTTNIRSIYDEIASFF